MANEFIGAAEATVATTGGLVAAGTSIAATAGYIGEQLGHDQQQDELGQARDELQRAQDEAARVRLQVADNLEQINDEQARFRDEIVELNHLVNLKNAELQTVNHKLTQAIDNNCTLEKKLKTTKQINADIYQQLEALTAIQLDMNQSLDQVTNHNFELSEENNELKQRNDQLQSELDSKNYVHEVTSSFSADTKSILMMIGHEEDDEYTDNQAEEDHRFHSNLLEETLPEKKQPQSVNRLDKDNTSPLYCALFDKGNKVKQGKNPIPQPILPSCRVDIVKLLLEQPQLNLDLGSNHGTIIDLLTGQMNTDKKNIADTSKLSEDKKQDPKKLLYSMVCQRYYANKTCSKKAIEDLHDNWQKLCNAKNKLTLIMGNRLEAVNSLITHIEDQTGRNFPKLYDFNGLSKEFNSTCALADIIYQAIIHNTCDAIKNCGIAIKDHAEIYRIEHRYDENAIPEKIKSLKMIHQSLNDIFNSSNHHIDEYWLAYCEFIDGSFKILEQGYILLETQSFNHFQQHLLTLNTQVREQAYSCQGKAPLL